MERFHDHGMVKLTTMVCGGMGRFGMLRAAQATTGFTKNCVNRGLIGLNRSNQGWISMVRGLDLRIWKRRGAKRCKEGHEPRLVYLFEEEATEIVLDLMAWDAGEEEESRAAMIMDEILPLLEVGGSSRVESCGVGYTDVEIVPWISFYQELCDEEEGEKRKEERRRREVFSGLKKMNRSVFQ